MQPEPFVSDDDIFVYAQSNLCFHAFRSFHLRAPCHFVHTWLHTHTLSLSLSLALSLSLTLARALSLSLSLSLSHTHTHTNTHTHTSSQSYSALLASIRMQPQPFVSDGDIFMYAQSELCFHAFRSFHLCAPCHFVHAWLHTHTLSLFPSLALSLSLSLSLALSLFLSLCLSHTHKHTLTHKHTHTHTHTHPALIIKVSIPWLSGFLLKNDTVCTRTHLHTHMRTHIHTHTYARTHSHIQTHTSTHAHTQAVTVRHFAQERHGIACECVWTCHAQARKRAHPQMYLHAHTMYT